MAYKRSSQQMKLCDGRMLGYAEYGDPDGVPIFYFHGFPGSRLDYLLFDDGDAAVETGARIMAVDRPGYGLSVLKRGRHMLDWPDDVIEVANALNIDRFAVLGISGGGPFAAACAFKIPGRLIATGIVCGMGPADAPGMKNGTSWTIPGKPAMIRKFILMLTALGVRKNPDQFLSQSRDTFSEEDRQLLDQPELAKVFVNGLQEAFRSGIAGANQDAALYTHPWGFRLQDISAQVHLWHGEQDENVPVSVGHYVADAIPNCNARFFREEGHLTLPHHRMREVLSTLISRVPGRSL
jgi:pimeloyl-ACP methyl ester carboxylesterase